MITAVSAMLTGHGSSLRSLPARERRCHATTGRSSTFQLHIRSMTRPALPTTAARLSRLYRRTWPQASSCADHRAMSHGTAISAVPPCRSTREISPVTTSSSATCSMTSNAVTGPRPDRQEPGIRAHRRDAAAPGDRCAFRHDVHRERLPAVLAQHARVAAAGRPDVQRPPGARQAPQLAGEDGPALPVPPVAVLNGDEILDLPDIHLSLTSQVRARAPGDRSLPGVGPPLAPTHMLG